MEGNGEIDILVTMRVEVPTPIMGLTFDGDASGGLYVTKVKPGGNAAGTGKDLTGLRFDSINGTAVAGMAKADVVGLIKASTSKVDVVFTQDVAGYQDFRRAKNLRVRKGPRRPAHVNLVDRVKANDQLTLISALLIGAAFALLIESRNTQDDAEHIYIAITAEVMSAVVIALNLNGLCVLTLQNHCTQRLMTIPQAADTAKKTWRESRHARQRAVACVTWSMPLMMIAGNVCDHAAMSAGCKQAPARGRRMRADDSACVHARVR